MKRILKFLKPYTKQLVISALLVSVSALCNLLLPTLMSDILKYGIRQKDFNYIIIRCAVMLAIAVVSLISVLAGTKISCSIVAGFSADLREDIFKKVNTLSFEEFGTLGTAALVTRATHDVSTVSWVASMLSSNAATIPMLFIGGVALALIKDASLAFLMLVFVPIIVFTVALVGKKVFPLWMVSDKYIDRQNSIMRERLRGIRVIRAFNTEEHEHSRIADATHIMAENIIKGNTTMGIISPLALLLLNFAVILIVFVGAYRMEGAYSALSAADIFAVTQYVTMVMSSVIMASFAITMFPRLRVASERINEIYNAKGMGDIYAGKDVEISGSIEFDNVSFSYGGDENALSDVSLKIKKGDRVAVIGGTGSGKSTLVSLLLGFRMPTRGKVLLDGVPTSELSKHCIRKNISSMMQGSAVYSGTIRENIAMGNPLATEDEILESAEIAQLSAYIASLPEGIDHEIKQAGKNLSGGQKQRIAIARAAVKNAPIYVFDDSFSALDFLTEKNLRSALNEKIKGKTQIVITQRITSAMSSDCIFVLDRGRLVDFGAHKELLSRCELYKEIFASQTGGKV